MEFVCVLCVSRWTYLILQKKVPELLVVPRDRVLSLGHPNLCCSFVMYCFFHSLQSCKEQQEDQLWLLDFTRALNLNLTPLMSVPNQF